MEEMANAGFQAPQCTVFVEPPFVADNISFAVGESRLVANAPAEMASYQAETGLPEGFDMAELLTYPPEELLGSYLAGVADLGVECSSEDFAKTLLVSMPRFGDASIFESDEGSLYRLSTTLEERFMVPPPQDIELMSGCYLYAPISEDEKAAMEAMSSNLMT